MDEENIIGYHGTSASSAQNIIKTQIFEYNPDDNNKLFLGAGVYFYYDRLDAIEWNIKDYRDNNNYNFPTYKDLLDCYAVIEANLSIEECNILNLDDREGLMKYKEIVRSIKDFLKPIEDYKDKNELATIINYLYKLKIVDDIYAIKKTFPFPIPNSYGARGIQKLMICIKKLDVLNNFILSEKIKLNEYKKLKILYK